MHAPSSASRPSVSGRALRPFAAPRNARISRGRPTAAAASVYEELIFGGDALLRAASWEDYLRLTRPPAPMPAPAPQPAAVPAPVPSPAQAATAAASTSGSADGKAKKSKFRSDWDAVEAGGGRGGGADYLSELGSSQMYNINVDHGAPLGVRLLLHGSVAVHVMMADRCGCRCWTALLLLPSPTTPDV